MSLQRKWNTYTNGFGPAQRVAAVDKRTYSNMAIRIQRVFLLSISPFFLLNAGIVFVSGNIFMGKMRGF